MTPVIAAWSGIDPTAVGGVLVFTVTTKVWETVEPLLSVAVTVMTATPAASVGDR